MERAFFAIVELLIAALYLTRSGKALRWGAAFYFLFAASFNFIYGWFRGSFGLPPEVYDPLVYQFYNALRYILYLLTALAFYSSTDRKTPLLKACVTAIVMAVMFTALFTGGYGVWYYPARMLLYGTIAAFAVHAFRQKSIVLLYLSSVAIVRFVSDLMKLTLAQDSLLLQAQQFLDPLLNKLLLLTMVTLLLIRPLEKKFTSLLPSFSPPTRIDSLAEVIPFPASASSMKSSITNKELLRDMDEIDEMFRKLTKITSASKKDFLTPPELAVYLDIDENEIDELLIRLKVEKIYLDTESKKWVVSKEHVKEALLKGDEREET